MNRMNSQTPADARRQQRYLDYPYGVGDGGAPNVTLPDDHLRDLILQVLFTDPGERVNLPEFGVGIRRFVFAPNGEALRASAQFLISANLDRWLGDRIDVNQVSVTSEPGYEEILTIEIVYTLKVTQQQQRVQVKV